MKRFAAMAFVAVLSLIYTQFGCAESSKELEPIKKEIKELKEKQESIIKEIQGIKKFLRIPEEFKETILNIGNDYFKGDKNAKVTLVEFSDYQ